MSYDMLAAVGSSLTVVAGAAAAGAFIWREMKRQSSRFAKAGDAMERGNLLQQVLITNRLWDNIAVLNYHAGRVEDATLRELQAMDGFMESHMRAVIDCADMLTDEQKGRVASLEAAFGRRLKERNPESAVPSLFGELYEKLEIKKAAVPD